MTGIEQYAGALVDGTRTPRVQQAPPPSSGEN